MLIIISDEQNTNLKSILGRNQRQKLQRSSSSSSTESMFESIGNFGTESEESQQSSSSQKGKQEGKSSSKENDSRSKHSLADIPENGKSNPDKKKAGTNQDNSTSDIFEQFTYKNLQYLQDATINSD